MLGLNAVNTESDAWLLVLTKEAMANAERAEVS